MDPASGSEADDDRILARHFSAGTSAGLERVYQAYGTLLYSVARAVLGRDGDAQDCVHDVLLRLWQTPAAYRTERGELRSYLLVAVRNDALTRRRDAARHFAIDARAARSEPAAASEMNDPIERARLLAAVGALPAEQRVALELAFFSGLTHVEVAQRLAAPLGTIKSRIALALRKLHAALAPPNRSDRSDA